jgi:hypothetical protein
LPDENDGDYETGFSFEGLTGIEEESETAQDQPPSETQTGQGTWGGLAIFWLVTLAWCTGSAFATVMISGAIAADLGTSEWTPVEGIVINSGVDTYSGEEGTEHCLWVEYEYTIENRTYDGSSISYSKDGNCDSWSSDADEDYPPGGNITVFVNPENHEEAVLLTGLSGVDFFMCCFLIFPLLGIFLFVACCMATYNSIMYPENYTVGNFVPGDTSTTLPPLDSDEDHTRSSGVDLDGDGIADDLYGVPQNNASIIDKIIGDVKGPAVILQTLFALLVVNGFIFFAITSESAYDAEFDVANEAMEGTSEWPTTTAWFSENFTFDWGDSGEYFSGSIIIYCSNTSESWECGENESGYERIEIPYRCTWTEQVGPLENPCDWAMQMFVIDAYHMSHSYESHWIFYDESGHCEWEGEPDDDNLWSCYVSDGDASWYDTWWQYCEHHLNVSYWYCTDNFGHEMSSPDNQNGTLYQPQEVQTTVNYDPDDPTRIAFVDQLEWHTGSDGFPIVFIIFPIIINLVLIGRIVIPIVRSHQA